MGDETALLFARREERFEMEEPRLDGEFQEQKLEGTTQVQHPEEHVTGTGSTSDHETGEQNRPTIDISGDHHHGREMGSLRGRFSFAYDRDQETRAEAHQRDQVVPVRGIGSGRWWCRW